MATGFNTQVGNGEYRLQFETDNKEHYLLMQSTARRCVDCVQMTNADRIRSMNDEELAMLLYEIGYDGGWDKPEYALDWLQQPAEEDDNETAGERKDGDGNG